MDPPRVDNPFVQNLAAYYDAKQRGFCIAKYLVKLNPIDVCLLLGLSIANGASLDIYTPVPCVILERRFSGLKIVEAKHCKNILQNILSKKESQQTPEDNESVVKLLILFLFALYLFPNSLLHIPVETFHYVDNLSTIGEFSQRTTIYRVLHSQLSEVKYKLQLKEDIRFNYIDSCTIIILVSITSII